MKYTHVKSYFNFLSFRSLKTSARLLSFFKILLPLLVGTGLAYQATQTLTPGLLLISLLCGTLIQLYIILMHDYAVGETDILPGEDTAYVTSKRLITAGLFGLKLIRRLGMATAGILILAGWTITFFLDRTYALPLLLLIMLFIHGYYFYPFRLLYRGLGEVLEVLGRGVLLPLLGYHLAGAAFPALSFYPLVPVILMGAVSTLTDGIKQFPHDLISGKKTFPLLCGTAATRGIIIVLTAASLLLCGLFFIFGIYGFYALLLGTVMPFFLLVDIVKEFPTATHEYPASLKKFKTITGYAVFSTYLGLILDFLTV